MPVIEQKLSKYSSLKGMNESHLCAVCTRPYPSAMIRKEPYKCSEKEVFFAWEIGRTRGEGIKKGLVREVAMNQRIGERAQF